MGDNAAELDGAFDVAGGVLGLNDGNGLAGVFDADAVEQQFVYRVELHTGNGLDLAE
jgi:hypothetical protein